MLAWLVHHWVPLAVGAGVVGVILWWLLKPPSWRDGEGDNSGLVDIGSFRQFH